MAILNFTSPQNKNLIGQTYRNTWSGHFQIFLLQTARTICFAIFQFVNNQAFDPVTSMTFTLYIFDWLIDYLRSIEYGVDVFQLKWKLKRNGIIT